MALVDADGSAAKDKLCRGVVLFDNEEVGSQSAHGAMSSLLENCLRRMSHNPGLISFK